MQALFSRSAYLASILFLFAFALGTTGLAQSRPQRPEPSKGEGKRNQRPAPKTEEELKKEEEERKRLEEEKKAVEEPDVLRVETDLVNVDAVVYNKKTGQIITGLKKENFAVFENGVKQTISSFATPDAPITVSLVLEYSKWTETFGQASGGYFEPGVYESVRPIAQFLSKFIKPPGDFASVIAFDIRPAPMLASAVPTIVYVKRSPASSTSTVEPRWTTSPVTGASMTTPVRMRCSRVWIRPSTKDCSLRAYS